MMPSGESRHLRQASRLYCFSGPAPSNCPSRDAWNILSASRLKAAGVRAIVGAHPHLFYEVEVDESFVCAYSLGNFVFDLCWDSRMLQSGVLDITFTKENISCRIWPIKIKEEGCLPTIVGEPLEVKEYCQIYNHGSPLKWPRMKKTISFWLNIYKGDTTLKLKFFINKILRLISLK